MEMEEPRGAVGALNSDSMSHLLGKRSPDHSLRSVCSASYLGIGLILVLKFAPASIKMAKIISRL